MCKITALRIGTFLLLVLSSCNFCQAQVFVNIEAQGLNDGSSWDNAYNNLYLALNEAVEGNEIWIATGTYLPAKSGAPKNNTFYINKGIYLYGGFAGTESKRSQRNPTESPTTLSGDLNQNDILYDFETNRSDNVWTVMTIERSTNSKPVIDGITFKGGHADGDAEVYHESTGGGLFIKGSVLLRNCFFTQNYSIEAGGALSVVADSEEAKVVVDSCHFSNNFSDFTGGAISFQFYGNGNSIITQNSIFSDNQAKVSGGAILMYSHRSSANNLYDLKNCSFESNSTTELYKGQAEGGGAIYVANAGTNNSAYIQDSDFLENSSMGFGGALGIRNKNPGFILYAHVNNCLFEENTADNGGALYYEGESIKDSLVIRECKFIGNNISELHPGLPTRGAAIHIHYQFESDQSRALVESCLFNKNEAKDGDGGAFAISPLGEDCFTSISNSSFTGNKSAGKGGAFFYLSTNGAYELKDCTFNHNETSVGGAVLYEPHIFGKRQFYIFFHGVLWVQILYSLLLFLIARERTSLYYALMLFGISLFFLVVFDSMYLPFINEMSGSTKIVLYQIGVFLSVFGLIKFAQEYLNINQLLLFYKKIVFYFLSFFLFTEMIFFARYFNLFGGLAKYASVFTFFGLLLSFTVGGLIPTVWAVSVLKKGYKPAKYFLLAMLLSGTAFLWLVISYFQLGLSGIPIMYIESLLLLSIITLALADGYRINILKKEKERAERLSELDIAKTRLYTNITHEFRTPLTVIMGASDLVKGNESEKIIIKRNSQQLLLLINQMLDLSKLEGDALKLDSQQGNIIPFTEYIVESFQSLADSKNIRLTFYRELDELNMDYDAGKMQQIISNLLSNAIKFTPASGKVIVHIKEELFNRNLHLTLLVRDNGSGIPEADIPHVFDRFFQVDASDLRRSEGSGIGLALVKELVGLMKGQIEVTSKVNKGTVFTVRIPISKVAPLRGKIPNLNESLLPTEAANDMEISPSFQLLTVNLPLALIIEDNKDIVNFLRSCLQRQYKIEVAYNGQQGIDKALDLVPDIIISDIMMPEADGFIVCKTLKSDERTSHVPIILLTAKATQEDRVHGLEVGADAYLSKPFHKEELEVRLQKLIELRQQLQNRYQNNSTTKGLSKSKEDEFIHKLRTIILERMEDDTFNINELCYALGLSRMHLHRKLKALTGMPATAFINTVRLQKAHELLSDTKLNISEVAYKVGFTNHSYFSKLFLNKFGKTPSEIGK